MYRDSLCISRELNLNSNLESGNDVLRTRKAPSLKLTSCKYLDKLHIIQK